MARVLVVEDEAAIVRVLKEGLEMHGFTVETAFNGAEAVAKVKENPPDAIVMDLSMPIKDGISATIEIRQMPEGREIPIIILTARGEDSDIEAGLSAQASQFLTKPVSIRELARQLSALLASSHRT